VRSLDHLWASAQSASPSPGLWNRYLEFKVQSSNVCLKSQDARIVGLSMFRVRIGNYIATTIMEPSLVLFQQRIGESTICNQDDDVMLGTVYDWAPCSSEQKINPSGRVITVSLSQSILSSILLILPNITFNRTGPHKWQTADSEQTQTLTLWLDKTVQLIRLRRSKLAARIITANSAYQKLLGCCQWHPTIQSSLYCRSS